jgi:hypothetical protein
MVEDGAARASCTVTTGSRSHRIVILADEYEIVTNPAPATEQSFLLFGGSQFQLRVPIDSQSAHFDYQDPQGNSGFTPGDQSSPDGKIVLLSLEAKPDAKYYTYVFSKIEVSILPAGPLGGGSAAARRIEPKPAHKPFGLTTCCPAVQSNQNGTCSKLGQGAAQAVLPLSVSSC